MADIIDTGDKGRDDRIFQLRLVGISARKIASQFEMTPADVERIIDKRMIKLDPAMRARAAALDYELLSEMQARFARDALAGDQGAGHLVMKICERKAAMLGTDAPLRMDPVQLTVGPKQTSIDKIEAAINRIRAHGTPSLPASDDVADKPEETSTTSH